MFLGGRYYKKIQDKMYELGEMPTEESAGFEIYKWKTTKETLYYVPCEGNTAAYSFSMFPKPSWKQKYADKAYV
jgi:hypothetical protein